MKECRFSDKQREIMRHLLSAAAVAGELSFEDLRGKLSWSAKPVSIGSSLRYLEQHGFLVRETRAVPGRQGRLTFLKPTAAAYVAFRS